MTVSSETIRKSYAGDGSQDTFPYTWKIYAETDLLVVERDDTTLVETEQVLNTDYTVTGVDDDDGGNVVAASAPASGKTWVIKLDLPFTQLTDWVENDPFPADTHEDAADRSVKLAQILNEKFARSLLLPVSSSLSGLELPEKTGDARILGWNNDGTLIELLTDLDVALTADDQLSSWITIDSMYNTGIGQTVFSALTTGQDNTALGYHALWKVTNGYRNVGIGPAANSLITSGHDNIAIGYDANDAHTTCTLNIAIGGLALAGGGTGGYSNLAIGYNSLGSLTTGAMNVALGDETLFSLATGTGNIALGYNAGKDETGSNKLYIANSDTATPTIYGELDNHNVGFGLTSFGTSGTRVLGMGTGVAPTTSPADGFQMYSADQAAGNACPHFRTENGKVIKLYQQAHIADPTDLATCITAIGSILDALEALGLLAAS